ncbi:electron transfer flavoprotein subunit alpha/FixB family protein [Paenarthrobacter sp. Z7-10]|nr:electron transfer flavoprotein subunit alpha/FixB family protein [Paenarthrobacter sp. Z7-10]MCZ2404601.1 electron transfer flavoprotein subunit alpha/FixB family protein [Paenarthrobacter sp. Z7-10]
MSMELLTLARVVGEPIVAASGPLSEEVRTALGSHGVQQIFQCEQSELREYLVAPKADFLAQVAARISPAAVLLDNSAEGKEIAARLGVALSAGVVTDAIGLDRALLAEKAVLAGSYLVKARATTSVAVITVKANSVTPEQAAHATAPAVETVKVSFGPASLGTRIVERTARPISGRPDLSEARIVVAGGRGVNGDFTPVEELADALGAAVGASRAATDAGWIEHSAQVGQTGKTVSPQLYISAGISGAIQQKAGMQTSTLIVAVNKDADSPVFEIADLGIVGDLFSVLPQATAEIKRRRS